MQGMTKFPGKLRRVHLPKGTEVTITYTIPLVQFGLGGKYKDMSQLDFQFVGKRSPDDPRILVELSTGGGGIIASGQKVVVLIGQSLPSSLKHGDVFFGELFAIDKDTEERLAVLVDGCPYIECYVWGDLSEGTP